MQVEAAQIRQIQTILSKRKLDRTERLDFLASEFNRVFSSTKELSFIEADELIYFLRTGKKQPANWAYFDNGNPQHRKLLSQLRTAQWVVENEKYGFVADLERLSNFLKSPKSPVNKPLKAMSPKEVSKIVFVFDQIIKGTYK
jgi:hypothetical protein